jgi:hypothetical protein
LAEDRRPYQPQKRILVVLDDFTTFHALCSGAGGRPRLKITATRGSKVSPYRCTLWEHAGGRLDDATSHNRGTLLFWSQSRPFTLAARVLEGARDRSYEWIKGMILPPDTMGASGRKIGGHQQPQQRNFVVLVTLTTFHARCSGAGGHPKSQLRVDKRWHLTSGHYVRKHAEGRRSLPATTGELGSVRFWRSILPFLGALYQGSRCFPGGDRGSF